MSYRGWGSLLLALACFAGRAASAEDRMTSPPVVHGPVVDLAIDEQGNRYITGTFYRTSDFNPYPGEDVKAFSPDFNSDIFLTRFNADGSYAWTQVFGGWGFDSAGALAVGGGTVYLAGWYNHPSPISTDNFYRKEQICGFVAAYDAQTGAPRADFGTAGVRAIPGAGQAEIHGLALAGGNLYVTGQTWSNEIVDPNTGLVSGGITSGGTTGTAYPYYAPTARQAFVAALDAASGASVAGFGTAGLWELSGDASATCGKAVAVANGFVYAAGAWESYPLYPVPMNSDPLAGAQPMYYPNPYGYTANVFAVALDAASGAQNLNFGIGGVRLFGETNTATAKAIAVSGNTLYVCGAHTVIPPPPPIDPLTGVVAEWNYQAPLESNAYVLALDASTGANQASFGIGGVKVFGRQFNDEGADLAISNGTLFLAGTYGNSYEIPGYYALPLPMGGGTLDGTMQKAGTEAGATTNMPVRPDGTGGYPAPINYIEYSDAFVLALDAASGALKADFSGDGFETFGGSASDRGNAVAAFGNKVYLAGELTSEDAGIGGLGRISGAGFYGFLLELDATVGGGGGVESNQAPRVDAGPDQRMRRPQFSIAVFPPPPIGYLDAHARDDGLPWPPGLLMAQWSLESASGPGEVYFDSPATVQTGVSFSAAGEYVLRITVSDGQFSASDTVSVSVADNIAPEITSRPAARPDRAATGQEVAFFVAASDGNNDPLSYYWDFGDGWSGYEAGSVHVYESPGTYNVTVTVSDGLDQATASLSVTVTGDPIGQGHGCDIKRLHFVVNFAQPNHDRIQMSGVVGAGALPPEFNPDGMLVTLNVGGVQVSFTLDRRGGSKEGNGVFKLTQNRRNHAWKFKLRLKNGAFGGLAGLENADVKDRPVAMPVSIDVGGQNFSARPELNYSAQAGAMGMAR